MSPADPLDDLPRALRLPPSVTPADRANNWSEDETAVRADKGKCALATSAAAGGRVAENALGASLSLSNAEAEAGEANNEFR